MKLLFFFLGIFSLHLTFQNNLCHIIWTWKNTSKVSPTIMSFFKGLGMILVMKTNFINQKLIWECSPHQYWNAWKNTCKNVSPTFKYLNFIFLTITNFRSNLSTCKCFKKYDFNNLAFEVCANKNFKKMCPKILSLSP